MIGQGGEAKTAVRGGVTLLIAALFACAIVYWAPGLVAKVIPASASAPLTETVFNIAVFVPLLLVAWIGGRIDRRSAFALGPRAGAMLGLGLLIGAAGVTIAMLYAKVAQVLVAGATPPASIVLLGWGGAVVLLQTVAEEVYFRGWLQPVLVKAWGAVPALLVTAVGFAGVHIVGGASAPLSLLNLLLGGLVFGLLALRGGGLAAAIGMHFAWNATEQLVWGLDPNPGVGGFGAAYDRELVGQALWGGSGEGLNASLGMTIVLLAILAAIAVMGRRGLVRPVAAPAAA